VIKIAPLLCYFGYMKKLLTWGSILIGALLIATALLYFTRVSGSLPTFMPGYIPDGTNIHYKHGIATLLLGIALFVFAWFKSAPDYELAEEAENSDE
jgi:hypothetical protein